MLDCFWIPNSDRLKSRMKTDPEDEALKTDWVSESLSVCVPRATGQWLLLYDFPWPASFGWVVAVSSHRPRCGNRGKPETDAKFEVGLTNEVSAERWPPQWWMGDFRSPAADAASTTTRFHSIDDASAVRGNLATRMSLGDVLRAAARSRGTCHGRDFNLGTLWVFIEEE